MGFNPLKSVGRAVKKVLKSKVGQAALLGLGAHFGPQFLGQGAGIGKWGSVFQNWKNIPAWKMGLTAGIGALGTRAMMPEEEEEEPSWEGAGDKGYQAYLDYRKYFPFGNEEPMFKRSQGGRVPAQAGLYANPHSNMNPMNQGLGSANLGSRSMGMTPTNMNQQMDPRTAQLQQQRPGVQTAAMPKSPQASEDVELIQLIKMLSSLGYPMEQLRGRTKEELVEMLVAVSGKGGEVIEGESEVVEAAQGGRIGYRVGSNPTDEVVEEQQDIEVASGPDETPFMMEEFLEAVKDGFKGSYEDYLDQIDRSPSDYLAQGGITRTGYALGQPVIPSKDGMQLDMRDSGGYQPHGKAEKHDDVRALLAQGEFVMTSDAVKGMGGGDREMGAKKMYNLMHNMEAMA